MQFISETFSFLARLLLRLALLIIGAVVALVLLCVGMLALLWVLLKALITGRKPVFVTTFMSFRQASQQFRQQPWNRDPSANEHSTASGDIIEGQAVEVRDDTALPHSPEHDRLEK